MISYYELLGMIKEDKAPRKIKVHLTREPRIYEAEYGCGDFSYYWLVGEKEDSDYHHYLAEDFLESMMFEKNIEIIEEEKKIPEKLNHKDFLDNFGGLAINDDKFIDKINEIIDYLKSKGDE